MHDDGSYRVPTRRLSPPSAQQNHRRRDPQRAHRVFADIARRRSVPRYRGGIRGDMGGRPGTARVQSIHCCRDPRAIIVCRGAGIAGWRDTPVAMGEGQRDSFRSSSTMSLELCSIRSTLRRTRSWLCKVIALLPAGELGKCALTLDGELYRRGVSELEESLERDEVVFHSGSNRGAFPRVLDQR